ncbi:carboxypeptidase M32 [Thaumasiovibrio subtropicus]|uniref:carboxypeptidase M32 n=1 Tax=Thaumasiovibrio subtropicus TaxID=1891207 RepID=UPI000B36233C|nr:carboxypeptidase M32 [Thaumasiovibrio subtropicus]
MAYQALCQHFIRLSRFHHLGLICGWDQAAMMPAGGQQARAEAMAELHKLTHQLLNDPSLEDWFRKAKDEDLSLQDQINLKEMHRVWQQSTLLPESLVEAKSLAGSKCEHAWRTQRPNNDWKGFSKNLEAVLTLSREEAQLRADATGVSPYEAMLELYEPGMTTAKLDNLFADVKTWLPNLIQTITEKQAQEPLLIPEGPFDTSQQKALGLDVMTLLGFDFNHGRLDVSAHPFCGGVPSDVRITTRYDINDFTSTMMGVIHETGHARYEQGLPKAFAGLPAGVARSMGVHESQSLFFEMQLSRHPEFVTSLAPRIRQAFDRHNDPALSADNLIKLNTRVKPGYIRVDADEVTYPAHVILRYEIERALIEGDLEVADLPDAWDEKMQHYLGLSTKDNFTNGCMQDIHWTDGSFGYFPSYTLGAMYAAQLMASVEKQVDVEHCLRTQSLSPIFDWLSDNIWSQGSLHSTDDLIRNATGETLNAAHFEAHLRKRYL